MCVWEKCECFFLLPFLPEYQLAERFSSDYFFALQLNSSLGRELAANLMSLWRLPARFSSFKLKFSLYIVYFFSHSEFFFLFFHFF